MILTNKYPPIEDSNIMGFYEDVHHLKRRSMLKVILDNERSNHEIILMQTIYEFILKLIAYDC